MSKTILITGFACLSVIAVAQSGSNDKASNGKGEPPSQATGRRMHEPIKLSAAQNKSGSTNSASYADGNKTTTDDWESRDAMKKKTTGGSADRESSSPSISEGVAPNPSNGQSGGGRTSFQPSVAEAGVADSSPKTGPRVPAGDLNGDGKADAAASASAHTGSTAPSASKKKPCGQRMQQTCTPSPAVVAPPPSGNNSTGVHVTKSTDISSTK